MSRETFKRIAFKDDSLERIQRCNEIIEEYQAQGLTLTLRQLYYQLVTKNIIPNAERSYKNLSALVTDARMAGKMDWTAIEDRVRQPQVPLEFRDMQHRIDSALRNYRLPRWEGQEQYVELWVEKDALAGVLQPIAFEYHITLMVNRGYSSASAMYESAQRFIEGADRASTGGALSCVLLYLGDHDPSGEDMVRDVAERLVTFGAEIEVKKVALTMTQVKRYKPPPNPAKLSDPRAAAYVAEHGGSSWEVDALPPNVLARLIRTELDALVDRERMDVIIGREEKDKAYLRRAVASYRKEEDE
jgi:hypothetical protein